MLNINPEPACIIQTIENGKKTAILSDSFKQLFSSCKNPQIIMAIGKSREGKSTLLNQLLKDKRIEYGTPRLNFPFQARGGEEPKTRDFQFVGPISSQDFCAINNIPCPSNPIDLFFIDSEGTGNISEFSDSLLHGLFTIESITSSLLFVSKGTIEQENLRYIFRYLQTYNFFSNTHTCEPNLFMIARDVGLINYDEQLSKLNLLRKEQDQQKKLKLFELLNKTSLIIHKEKLHYFAEMPFDQEDLFWLTIEDIAKKIIEISSKQSIESPDTILENFNRVNKIVSEYSDILNPNKPLEDIMKIIFEKELERIIISLSENVINEIQNEIENTSLNELVNMSFEEYNQRKQNEIVKILEKKVNECFSEIINIVPDVYKHKTGELLQSIERKVNSLKEQTEKNVNETLVNMINEQAIQTEQEMYENINKEIKEFNIQELRKIALNDDTFTQYVKSKIEETKNVFENNIEIAFNTLSTLPKTINQYNNQQKILCLNIENYTIKILDERILKSPPWPTNKEELIKCIGKPLENGTTYSLYYNKDTPYKVEYRNNKFIIPNATVTKRYRKEQLQCWKGTRLDADNTNPTEYWFDPRTKYLELSDASVIHREWKEGGHRSLFVTRSPRPQLERTWIRISLPEFWYIESYIASASVSINEQRNDMTWCGNGCVTNVFLIPRSEKEK